MTTRSSKIFLLFVSIGLGLMLWAPGWAQDVVQAPAADCGHYTCQFEKQSIDATILGHARESKTVMFGEIHDSVVAEEPPPLEDSRYVISLLERLKTMGYGYLVLEVQTDAPQNTHSFDILRCLQDYRNGKAVDSRDYPHAKPGWVELMLAALKIGFKPVFFHRFTAGADRDTQMFRDIREQVLDRDADAKVLVFIGAGHISEVPTQDPMSLSSIARQPLGLLLSNFTQGRNYSVYIGYPDDTPVGCDLVISRFVWGRSR